MGGSGKRSYYGGSVPLTHLLRSGQLLQSETGRRGLTPAGLSQAASAADVLADRLWKLHGRTGHYRRLVPGPRGASFHQYCAGSGRWRGQTSSSVAASYSLPFFMT